MFSTLRTRFGIPGVISVMALVFAMLGGAYAASDSGDGGKATASAKVKRGARGPKGATGPAGPVGPAGVAGQKGATGPAGTNGHEGTDGTDGADGESVDISPYVGPECEEASLEEGVKFTNATGTAYVCNGAGGTGGGGGGLPGQLGPGQSETGAWTWMSSGEEPEQFALIGWPIPLSSTDAAAMQWATVKDGVPSPNCPGSTAAPEANPGYICIYLSGYQSNTTRTPFGVYKPELENKEVPGVGTSATFLYFEGGSAGEVAQGTFAITAPES